MLSRVTIRQALIALAVGVVALLVVLLIENVLILSKLDRSLERDNELATAMLAASDLLSNTGTAISNLRDIALTGDLDSDARARSLIADAKAELGAVAPELESGVVQSLERQLDELEPVGIEMARAYLLDGREAGNRIMYESITGFDARAQQLTTELSQVAQRIRGNLENNAAELTRSAAGAQTTLITTIVLLLILVPVAFYLLYRKLIGSIDAISNVVEKLTGGDYSARCRLSGGDELAVLASAFDRLLDERVEQLAQIERENDALNNSIIRILEATGELAQRDLRVNIPVTDDVTGAMSDAINGAVADIAAVLNDVRQIALQVRDSSTSVDHRADVVSRAADTNLEVLEQTLEQLNQASQSMAQVVDLAARCEAVAVDATRSTQDGLTSVVSTTEGMTRIREAIQETSKRIKRLGERSQEISGIVGIIKDIAERTHVLALNARIQASSAGEAGRGFSVVAEEVKTLADSSRKATDQIASLIQNIQVETNDTIATMEKAVTEVVNGAELSEQAGAQMTATQQTTNTLADVVRAIASASGEQAEITKAIAKSAGALKERSLETRKEAETHRQESAKLAEIAERLTGSVGQFRLPEAS